MMHIVEIHGEMVSSSEYFFLSHNYHDNFKGGKWDLEKLRSQILLTDLKIL